jgi:Flp pilus assembly protein TadB
VGDDNPTVDQVAVEDTDNGKIEKNLKSRTTWLRLLFMCIFCLLISLAGMVGSVVVVLGFLWVLFTGEINRQLQQTGQSLASYIYEIVRYLTFNVENKPFPFGGDWPSGKSEE